VGCWAGADDGEVEFAKLPDTHLTEAAARGCAAKLLRSEAGCELGLCGRSWLQTWSFLPCCKKAAAMLASWLTAMK